MPPKTYGLVRLEGVDKAIDRLREIERRVLNQGLKDAYTSGAEVVRADAERRAPRGETLLLSGSMKAEWDSRTKRARVGPGREAYYGFFQEFGTSRHPAQPFLRPALDANRGEVLRIVGMKLKQTIESRL